MNEHELEVKFYLTNPRALESRLRAHGANLVHMRTYEINLRYDTPTQTLGDKEQVLRLRQDTRALMTYKGPSQEREDVTVRQEIEFQVSDFLAAQHFLEALGYQVAVRYEKYRTTYDLEGVKITLDEMPFGFFCEVEGPDPASIQNMAKQLELDWPTRVMDSYLVLFSCLKTKKGMDFRDLTFQNFEGMSISPDDLGLRVSDR